MSEHCFCFMLDRVKHTRKADINDGIPLLSRMVVNRSQSANACSVDGNIYSAERLSREAYQPLEILLPGHVNNCNRATFRADGPADFLEERFIAIANDNHGTLFGEQLRRPSSDARGSPGEDCRPTRQPIAHRSALIRRQPRGRAADLS